MQFNFSRRKRMFLKIDEWLIMWAQWGVRQAELYARCTRRMLHAVVLFCTQVAVTIASIIAVTYIVAIPFDVFFTLVQSFVCFAWWKIFIHHRNLQRVMPEESHVLPKEICTRKVERVSFLCLAVYGASATIVCAALLFYDSRVENIVGLAMMTITTVCWYTLTCLEYIICTVSIPPQERARREYERDRRSYAS